MDARDPILHLRPGDPLWPTELDDIDGAPDELWARGRAELIARRPRVALVGTRAPTPYGLAQARRFAAELAGAGVSVVSGLARGIDQAAHAGALDAGGSTIAVLGSGVDRPWPEGEATVRVASEGLLLSEFPPGAEPRRHHFPLRNRIISGLSSAVVVVEAAAASGSLITARWAADQGKLVFAIPGRVDQPMSRGCHRVIREGAALVEDPAEILAEIGALRALPGADASAHAAELPPHPVLDALQGETLSADELAERLTRPVTEILVELVELELAGRVARSPGGLWRLLERGA